MTVYFSVPVPRAPKVGLDWAHGEIALRMDEDYAMARGDLAPGEVYSRRGARRRAAGLSGAQSRRLIQEARARA